MANNKIENITYENVITAGTANSLMIQYERGKAAPMDITDVFATLNAAKNYAMNGNNAYVGKTLSVIENNKVDVYKINYNNSIDKLVDENDIENLSKDIKEYIDIISADTRLVLLEADQHKHDNIAILNNIIESRVNAWNNAEQNAKNYASGLSVNYDVAGAAASALTEAKDYASGLSVNYDVAGAAASALTEAKDYLDSNLNYVRLHIGLNKDGSSILSGKTLVKIIQELQSKESDNVFDSLTVTGDGSNTIHINVSSDIAHISSDNGSINMSSTTTFENGFDASGDVYINGDFYLLDSLYNDTYRLCLSGGTLFIDGKEIGSDSGGIDPTVNSSTAQTFYLLGKSGSTSGKLSTSELYVSPKVYSDGSNIYATSDETLKDIVKNIDCDLDVLAKLPKFNFTWKNDSEKKLDLGTSAQKVQEIYPELVTMDPEGNLGVAYDKLSIVALAAVDKLHSENLELKERLRKIEEKLGL